MRNDVLAKKEMEKEKRRRKGGIGKEKGKGGTTVITFVILLTHSITLHGDLDRRGNCRIDYLLLSFV